MKLNLKKVNLVNLSADDSAIPKELTHHIIGGNATGPKDFTKNCLSAECATNLTCPPPGDATLRQI